MANQAALLWAHNGSILIEFLAGWCSRSWVMSSFAGDLSMTAVRYVMYVRYRTGNRLLEKSGLPLVEVINSVRMKEM